METLSMAEITKSREAFEERRIQPAGFNGCLRKVRGEYCQPCVAQATGYTYTGDKDRRLKPYYYSPHRPDTNFENWYNNNCTVDLDMTSAKLAWVGHKKHIRAKLQSEAMVERVSKAIANGDRDLNECTKAVIAAILEEI